MKLQRLLAHIRNLLRRSKRSKGAKQTPSRKASCASTSHGSSSDSSPRHHQALLHETAPACEDEKSEQSPIDICAMDANLVRQDDEDIEVTVSSARAHVVHTGTNFHVEWEGEAANALTIKGKTYYAVQFHFHTPSEHTLCGKHEAMELHLVHQANDGSLAVVALFFREGSENAFLAQFWDALPALYQDSNPSCTSSTEANNDHHHGVTVQLRKQIDPDSLHLLAGQFYRYRGSLTTPPYTEGVEWIVLQDVAEASAQQIACYRRTIPRENAREVQPRNHRLVTLRRPCACAA